MLIHSFCVEIAKEYGMSAAVLFNHIAYGVTSNKANNVNIYDGEAWVFNSVSSYAQIYPYMSGWQVRDALTKLEKAGLIKSANYNHLHLDRTKWYTLTEKGKELNPSDLRCTTNGFVADHKPIPFNNKQSISTLSGKSISDNTESVNVSVEYVITLILNDNTEYGITKTDIDHYRELYPAVDIMQQLRNMKGWCEANPTNRKTRRGITKFINAWLAKAQNSAPVRRDQPDTSRENLKLRGKMI